MDAGWAPALNPPSSAELLTQASSAICHSPGTDTRTDTSVPAQRGPWPCHPRDVVVSITRGAARTCPGAPNHPLFTSSVGLPAVLLDGWMLDGCSPRAHCVCHRTALPHPQPAPNFNNSTSSPDCSEFPKCHSTEIPCTHIWSCALLLPSPGLSLFHRLTLAALTATMGFAH